jgi:tetraacyldisaccharide 4'-kinase
VIKRYKVDQTHGLVILDDGFQHRAIQRDVEIVLLPGEVSPWESGLIPLGNLRESFDSLKRAGLILITCADKSHPFVNDWKALVSHYAPQSICLVAERKLQQISNANGKTITDLSGKWGAFCGIADPIRFQHDLRGLGINGFFKVFPDHHHYRREEMEHLISEAQKSELDGLVTTQKDFFKVRKFFSSTKIRLGIADIHYLLPDKFWRAVEQGITLIC